MTTIQCVETIADLRASSASSADSAACIKVLGYYQPGDNGGGDFYWDEASTDAENGGTIIVPASNPSMGRWKRVIDGPLSVKWFGAIADGQSHPLGPAPLGPYNTLPQAQAVYPHATSLSDELDWAATQATLNQLSQGVDVRNFAISVPAGTYLLSHTLQPPNSASHWQLVGEGKLATQFRWVGGGGLPMIKLLNARGVGLKDFGLFGRSTLFDAAGIPSHGIVVHRGPGKLGEGAPAFNTFERLFIGNYRGEVIENGIAYTAENYEIDSTYDSNNEQGTFVDLNIENVLRYGLSFEHSNSLLHKIYGGVIAGDEAAINNIGPANKTGGSFMLYGTALTTKKKDKKKGKKEGSVFRLGSSRHAISIVGAAVESEGALLTTTEPDPTIAANINFIGGSFHVKNDCKYAILFNGLERKEPAEEEENMPMPEETPISHIYQLSMSNVSMNQELKFKFSGLNTYVTIRDSDLNLLSLEYDNEVLLDNCSNDVGAGEIAFINEGNGKLVVTNPRQNFAHPDRYRLPANDPTPSLAGYDYFQAVYTEPTEIIDFQDGYPYKSVTIYFHNDKAIIKGNRNIRTADSQDIVFSPQGGFIRLRKMDSAFRNLWFVEDVYRYS